MKDERKAPVYGTIIDANDSCLTVSLDSGMTGIVSREQISRKPYSPDDPLDRLIGRRLGFYVTGSDGDMLTLSAKAYEDSLFEDMEAAFRSKEKNVYLGRLTSIDVTGRFAYYSMGQGLYGSVHLKSFCRGTIYSFRDVVLPRELPVAITNIDEKGRLSLSAKPAFGDFEYEKERLNIGSGSCHIGTVSAFSVEAAGSIVSLAPNITIIVDNVLPVGSTVEICCHKVSPDRRIRASVTNTSPSCISDAFDFNYWVRPISELPEYIDIDAFEKSLKPAPREKKAASEPAAAPIEHKNKVEIDYNISVTKSPFVVGSDECVEWVPQKNRSNKSTIDMAVSNGYLKDDHFLIARAVNFMGFATPYLLQRHIDVFANTQLSYSRVTKVLKTLVMYQILCTLRLKSENGSAKSMEVYLPGAFVTAYTGDRSSLGNNALTRIDARYVKERLAANQLLIGSARSESRGIENLSAHPYLKAPNSKIALCPTYRFEANGRQYFIEAVRAERVDSVLEKLDRYNVYLTAMKVENATVLITADTKDTAKIFEENLRSKGYQFAIRLTTDLECFPFPIFTDIPAAAPSGSKKGLFGRLKTWVAVL